MPCAGFSLLIALTQEFPVLFSGDTYWNLVFLSISVIITELLGDANSFLAASCRIFGDFFSDLRGSLSLPPGLSCPATRPGPLLRV